MIRPSVASPSLYILTTLLALTAGAGPLTETEQHLHDHLQSLDREVRFALSRAERQAVAGRAPAADLRRKAEHFRRHLRSLEAQVNGWGSERREELVERIRLLELVLRNLDRAAASLERNPDGFAARSGNRGPMAVGAAPFPARGKTTPVNDACANAQEIGFGTFVGDTNEATNDGSSSCGFSNFASDVWFKLPVGDNHQIFVDTFGSGFDTVLAVHGGCPGTYNNTARCSDNVAGLQSAIELSTNAGDEVLIRVAGYAGASGPFTLNVGPGGSVSGIVTAAATGAPIANVSVAVALEGEYTSASATTDPDGAYKISGIRPGTYLAFIQDSSRYAPEIYDGIPCSGQGCFSPEGGTPIVVRLNAETTGIDFALELGGSISGTVRKAATGRPLASSEVAVWDNDGELVAYEFTDDSGRYSLEGLSAGPYFLTAREQEHQGELHDGLPCPPGCDPTVGTAVVVGTGTAAVVDFELRALGAISGRVTDAATGAPIRFADVQVSPRGDGPPYGGFASTDNTGRYTIGGLAPGSYVARSREFISDYRDEVFADVPCGGTCDLTAGTPITVELDSTTMDVDFALDRLGQISGSLNAADTGEPVSTRVLVWDASGDLRVETGGTGSYLATGLLPGTYFVTTESFDPYDSFPSPRFLDELYDDLPCFEGCDPTAGTPVAVAVNETSSGIDFDLVQLGEISGTVIAAATGDPLRNVVISVWDAGGALAGWVTTGYMGDYAVLGLAAGTYFVRTQGDEYGEPFPFGNELYDDIPCEGIVPQACDVTLGTPIEVRRNRPVAGIDFALGPARPEVVKIAGRVSDVATGQPISSVRIEVYDRGGSLSASDFTNADGDYGIVGIPPGSYFVRTRFRFEEEYYDDPFPYLNELYDDLPCSGPYPGCDPTAGTQVNVDTTGTAEGIDFALDRLGTITGTITDAATGEPIGDYEARVAVLDAFGSFVGSDEADSSGTYEVVGLVPGTYFVRASADDYPVGYTSEVYDGLSCSPDCDVTAGTPIAVGLGEVAAGIDFTLDRPGSIAGMVVDAVTGSPVQANIRVWSEGGFGVPSAFSDAEGRYTVENLGPGIYFVAAERNFYFNSLFAGIRCPREGCDPASGTPVTVEVGTQTAGVDFSLSRGGVVSGHLTDALSGEELESADVAMWDGQGHLVAGVSGGLSGRFTFDTLPAGTYFVRAGSYSYHHELFGGVLCPGSVPEDCDPTTGTPLVVTEGSFTAADFALLPACSPSATTLCLNDRRFQVDAEWEDFVGGSGSGEAFQLTDDSGYFWFFDSANVEMVVKVLDACVPPFDRFWVFAAGLTNVRTRLTVTDTVSREEKIYVNPLGTAFLPVRDTGAFATCDTRGGGGTVSSGLAVDRTFQRFEVEMRNLSKRHLPIPRLSEAFEKACDGEGLCLQRERFRVEAAWRTPDGTTGAGQPVRLTNDTGYFWFFDDENVEVVVKVLDACNLGGFENFWVFAAGLTDIEVVLRVTDTVSGEVREYVNALGSAFQAVQDTGSFETCP